MTRFARALGATLALLMLGGGGVSGPANAHAGPSAFPRDERPGGRSHGDAASASTSAPSGPHSPPVARPVINPVFRPLLPQLKAVTIPVLLPTYLPRPDAKGLRLYATVGDRGPYSYLIDVGFSPDCRGATVCRLGEVTGGPEVDTPTIFDYPQGRRMRLRDGAPALYYPYTCGASCGDSVLVFKVGGVVYTVSLKAGSLRDVLAMANSVAPATTA